MAFRQNDFSARVVVDPKGAAREIVALYQRLGASLQRVARHIGVSEATMTRWVRRLEGAGTGILARIDRERVRAGGRPPQGWSRRALEKQGRRAAAG